MKHDRDKLARSMIRRRSWPGLLAGIALLTAAGCTARTDTARVSASFQVGGVTAHRVREAPKEVEQRPHVPFQGGTAYLIDGRWYFKSPEGRWALLREEPRELARYRITPVEKEQPSRGRVVVDGYRAEKVDRPQGVYDKPRVQFGESYAYLVGGRWYYNAPDAGWVMLHEESETLREARRMLQRSGSEFGYPSR